MSILLSPIRINTLELKNRIIFPPMSTNFADNGAASPKHLAYHLERVDGGCALNMLEATFIETAKHNYRLALDDDSLVPGLKMLADAIHAHGGRVGIQFQHQGRCASPEGTGCRKRLVSIVPGLTDNDERLVMTHEDIQHSISQHVQAARRAVQAGVDLIELHGAHGYLIEQFMSPLTNRRTDAYGGSFENRMRYPLELLAAMRAELGTGYPIAIRISVEEMLPGGIDLELSKRICAALVTAGIDAISISVALRENYEYSIPPAVLPEGWLAGRAESIRRHIQGAVPIALAGRILTCGSAERLLQSGAADLACMGRALIADPELVQKTLDGRENVIQPCLGCNAMCIHYLELGIPICCAVNPRVGNEALYPKVKAEHFRKVVVIGAGVGGLSAAATAAERGHEVTLLERRDIAGGLMDAASKPPFKERYAALQRSMSARATAAGVSIKLGSPADIVSVTALQPDVVMLATGSEPVVPGFCQGKPVLSAQSLLRGAPAGKRILILGGGSVGCETAEFAAEHGHAVTLLEMREALAPDMEWRWRKLLLPRLAKLGVIVLLGTKVLEILDDGSVNVQSADRGKYSLPGFDTIVLALGYRPSNSLQPALEAAGFQTVAVGDCQKVGLAGNAIQSGFAAAYAL